MILRGTSFRVGLGRGIQVLLIGSQEYIHPGEGVLDRRGLRLPNLFWHPALRTGTQKEIQETQGCGAAGDLFIGFRPHKRRRLSGSNPHQIQVVGQHFIVIAIDELEALAKRVQNALLTTNLEGIALWCSGRVTIVRIPLGHGILGYDARLLDLWLLLAEQHIVQIELPRVVRSAVIPLTSTVIARGTALALGHHRDAVLQRRRALLGGTATRSTDAEANVTRPVHIRAHLLALRVELGAHSATSIALQALRHALEVLVRGFSVADFLRGFARGLAAAIIAHRAAGGVHKDGLTALHGQHALGLYALLGAAWKEEVGI